MGNIQNLASRICKKSPPQQSIFSQQQQLSYSKTTGKKCLQRIIDIDNIGHSNSLKKIYRYLHPALKYILYCKQESLVSIEHMEDKDKHKMHNKGENIDKDNQIIDVSLQENFILIHQQELILSAGTVLQMYCEYLNHVVPANISYFHFMRQKDLYIHYCTLKYVLQAGHSGTMFKTSSKSPSIFLRLKAEPRRSYIKLISHWLYDMIKYKCSAIYLASPTLPHLISIHTSILCGLMCYDVNTNFLANLKTEAQKIQTYQHCLFSFLYVLTEAHIQKIGHSQQGNGCLQLAVIGITKILELMWTDISPQHAAKIKSKIMYAPSYWYASHVGFIHQPTLQTIAYHILTDMLLKIDQPIPDYQSKMLLDSKQSGNSEVQADQDYLSFLEQQSQKEKGEKVEHMGHHGTPKSEVNQLMASNINQQHKNSEQIMSGQISQGIRKYERINLVSQGLMFGCLGLIIRHFSDNLQLQPLHALLLKQSKVTLATSLLRPYILSLTKQLQQQPKSPGIWPQLIKYCEQNRMDYSTRSNIIPYTQVENRFQIFVHKMLGRVLLSYGKQVDKTEGQIWGALGRIGTR